MASAGDRHDAFLERFDAHIARFDDHLTRFDERLDQDNRAWGSLIEVLTAMERRLEDMGDQIRANTQAILRLVDRLDGGNQPR